MEVARRWFGIGFLEISNLIISTVDTRVVLEFAL